jgi:cyclohexanone monooxygenase
VTGRGGRRLHDTWHPTAVAYLGMAVHGFPNLFVLYGPNTNQGGNSIILILEAQARYVRGALEAMGRAGAGAIDVTQEAQDRYDAELQAALGDTVWATGCRSYFTDAEGRVVTQLPWTASAYAARTSAFAAEDYEVSPAG